MGCYLCKMIDEKFFSTGLSTQPTKSRIRRQCIVNNEFTKELLIRRLFRIYWKYNKEKLQSPTFLISIVDFQEGLFKKLEEKYGPEPDFTEEVHKIYMRYITLRIYNLYKTYTQRIETEGMFFIEQLLKKYENREYVLIREIVEKYGSETCSVYINSLHSPLENSEIIEFKDCDILSPSDFTQQKTLDASEMKMVEDDDIEDEEVNVVDDIVDKTNDVVDEEEVEEPLYPEKQETLITFTPKVLLMTEMDDWDVFSADEIV